MITNGYLYKFNDIWFIKFVEASLRLIKFLLMPLMPVVASKAIFETGEKSKFSKMIWIILKAYILLGDALLVVGFIKFLPSTTTHFYQNMMYDIYVTTFIYVYYNELVQCLDGMTGLLNQKSFSNYLEARENEEKKCLIIIMDVNDFKYINDNYGHEFGDKILIEVSKIIKESYKKYGKCYRMGGDEFAIIMQTGINQIDTIKEKFTKRLN